MSEIQSTKSLQETFRYTDSYHFMDKLKGGMPPLIICVACNGGIQGKEANEAIPETADEIAESVHAAFEAGASMVHVHARDPKDLTQCAGEPEPWIEVISKIRKACPDILVNATTGGGPNMTMEQPLFPRRQSRSRLPQSCSRHEHVPLKGA
jgi:3-keto-5-aminohexanoate cleavage enzyme